MKKSVKRIAVAIVALLILFLGANWHAPLLSLVDGTRELKKPEQAARFEINPEQASFIFNDLVSRRGHWGDRIETWVFIDSVSYYFVDFDDPMPAGRFMPYSWYAKTYGTRINGADGTVFNRALGEWDRKGYLHISRAEFARAVTNGMHRDAIWGQFNFPFAQDSCRTGGTWQGWNYWCRDGEVFVELVDDKVINVNTNCTWIRI